MAAPKAIRESHSVLQGSHELGDDPRDLGRRLDR